MSIAMGLMESLLDVATEQRARRILEVEIICGVMQQVVPDALQLAFEAVTQNTIAQGARLKIVEEAISVRCRACGQQYAAAIDNYRCPLCSQADAEIVAGRDIVLRSVTCETDSQPGGLGPPASAVPPPA
jgi:hydrogenase nickel incorporation protein HypA/HybF